MKIEDFCRDYGGNARKISQILRQWQFDELDELLSRLTQGPVHQIAGSAVIAADAIHNGSLIDHVPSEVKESFKHLLKEDADTYAEMKSLLRKHLRTHLDGSLAIDDRHVINYTNYLKGQIGENLLKDNIGTKAEFAPLNQKAWDLRVETADGSHDYVQVKLYTGPSAVVQKMREVQEQLAAGEVDNAHGELVKHVYFAVPEDIKEGVQRLAEKHGVADMLYDKTIPIDASRGAALVHEGMNHVGPEQLEHFFSELLVGTAVVGSIHGIVNGFLWYKGSKEFSGAFAGAVGNTAISATGMGAGLLFETWLDMVTAAGLVGIGTRLFLGRMARSRWSFAEFLDNSIARTKSMTSRIGPATV